MVKIPRIKLKMGRPDFQKWQRRGLKVLTVLARTSLPEILYISTFIISHFLPNADFSYPYELMMPIALLGIVITIFFYAYRLVFRRVLTAHIASLPLAYYLYHYADLSRYGHAVFGHILSGSLQTPFTLSILYILGAAVVFGLIAFGIVKLASLVADLSLDLQLTKLALFIVTFNFIVQAIVLGNFWFQARRELAYDYTPKQPTRRVSATISKPDIYYFVFDRYTNAEVLKNVYNYDNSSFLNYLNDQQFVTRDNAYSNYPFTMSSISSTLAMSYEGQLGQFASDNKQTGFPYRTILNNPPVAQILRQNGYQYNMLSSWWDFDRIGTTSDTQPTKAYRLRILGHNFYQSDFSRDIINNTVLAPLVNKGVGVGSLHLIKYDLDYNPAENFESQMTAISQISESKHTTPQFTYTHILSPHDPYVFNADGTPTEYSQDRDDNGEDEYEKYVNQLTYVNTRFEKMITSLKQANPNAVILIQSDEGPYPKEFRGNLSKTHYFDPKDLPIPHMQQKLGILASYYLPGVDKADVAANMNSNVNTFRFVLSHYLGYNLPNLPDCHFSMGDKFNVFSYTLLNKQLTGEDATKQCAPYL